MFSCEIFDISENTFFTEHFWANASELLILAVPVCQVTQKKLMLSIEEAELIVFSLYAI